MTDESDIEDIREKRLRELREKHANNQTDDTSESDDQREKEAEAKKKQILRENLTEDARQRLNNVRMVNEGTAQRVEQSIIQLAQRGRIQEKITDEKMKEILREANDDSPDFDIRGMSSRRNS